MGGIRCTMASFFDLVGLTPVDFAESNHGQPEGAPHGVLTPETKQQNALCSSTPIQSFLQDWARRDLLLCLILSCYEFLFLMVRVLLKRNYLLLKRRRA
jgi:hypothetical protein